MMSDPHPVLAGLNGWHRFGSWSAHFFVDGRQQCNTAHGNFNGGQYPPRRPDPVVDFTPHGQPYGRVCQKCLKVVRRPTQATAKENK